LNDVAVVNDRAATWDAVAKTFRYLDEEEVRRQRKAAKEAKGTKGRNETLADAGGGRGLPSRGVRRRVIRTCAHGWPIRARAPGKLDPCRR
jgi:hypothetical protein